MLDFSNTIKAKYALKNMLIPIDADKNTVRVAFHKQPVRELLNELRFILNKNIQCEIWDESKIREEIRKRYGPVNTICDLTDSPIYKYIEHNVKPNNKSEKSEITDQYVINFVNQMISDAIQRRASDIHIELYEQQIRIRFRIDGKLREQEIPKYSRHREIISRIKIMALMDISEKRRPQDGRIRMRNGANHDIDIRVSTLPGEFGEKIVLRILDKSSLNLNLESLGFEEQQLDRFKKVLGLPNGLVLVTGPTGSGKTTTLYSAMNYLNTPEVNIISIEDPIEYNLRGINQTQVRPDIGLTFASILRTILRQDPNIIMVGEIRDAETAEMSIRSANTGHLVLSTLHTNDALSAIARLTDMGVESYLLANSLKLIVAQRLVRKICPKCKTSELKNQKFLIVNDKNIDLQQIHLSRGAGCNYCQNSGYHGREAVIEQLEIDEQFSDLIQHRAGINEMRRLARTKGIESLYSTALKKAYTGVTTIAEVFSETSL